MMRVKALFPDGLIQFRVREKSAVRVKRAETFASENVKPDGLNNCLECWKLYMLSDDRDLSASRMNLHGGAEDPEREAYESDVYAEQRKADLEIGAATEAMIRSLRAQHESAISKKCGISSVWKFQNLDYANTLIEAEEQLTTKLRKNIATATRFK